MIGKEESWHVEAICASSLPTPKSLRAPESLRDAERANGSCVSLSCQKLTATTPKRYITKPINELLTRKMN